MKTFLAIQVFLVSFKLIIALTKTTSFLDDTVSVIIEYKEPSNYLLQNSVKMIKTFENKVSSFKKIQIPEEDTEFINEIKFKYWLSDSSFIEVKFGNESILKSRWMVGKALKLIVHGWSYARPGEQKVFCIKNAYINSQKYNVMTLDWSTIASSKYYFEVTRFSSQVGIILGYFLINLVVIGFVRPSDIHIIGHSIGAHVAGKSGKIFLDETNENIDRITGLDPASPGFVNSFMCVWMINERLGKNDAIFVDVIHTETRLQGVVEPIGHVDFYPNKGKSIQPGCENFNLIEALHCSHSRAYEYYYESINNPLSFESWKCNAIKEFNIAKCIKEVKNFMGHHANRNVQGIFYLETYGKSPFTKDFN